MLGEADLATALIAKLPRESTLYKCHGVVSATKEALFVHFAIIESDVDRSLELSYHSFSHGTPDEAFNVLNELTLNAVNESRFDDGLFHL